MRSEGYGTFFTSTRQQKKWSMKRKKRKKGEEKESQNTNRTGRNTENKDEHIHTIKKQKKGKKTKQSHETPSRTGEGRGLRWIQRAALPRQRDGLYVCVCLRLFPRYGQRSGWLAIPTASVLQALEK